MTAEAPTSLPAWMLETEGGGIAPSGRRRRRGAAERTLDGVARALERSLFSEELAARAGTLQEMDPRLKTVCLAVLLLAALLVRHLPVLAAMYALVLVLAWASLVPLGRFAGRVWLFVPLFTGLIVLPSIFNLFRPGDPLLVLWHFGEGASLGPWQLPAELAVTRQGLQGALLLVTRTAVSVSLVVLLVLTTRWSVLMGALRALRLPRVFVLVLAMTYRYIHLLLGLVTEMHLARLSRTATRLPARRERRLAAAGIGTVLEKSQVLGTEIHEAMISRGYSGEPLTLSTFSLRPADLPPAALMLLSAAAAWGGDRLLG